MFAKKNLVAAAALLAVAGVAHADVKLYGMVDASFGSYELAHPKDSSGSRVTKVESGDMMTSYIGVSGEEDLGSGLKAGFALESFLKADTGTTATNLAGGFWGRTSNVYLAGNFGTVALGQYDNPLFTSGYTYNPFGSSMTFSPTMRHFYSGGDFAAFGFDTGWVNSVTYISPVMGGFQLTGQFAAKETTAANTKNSYTLSGSYNNGPFSAALTYAKAGNSSTAGTVANPLGVKTAYFADQKVTDAGASYDFGVLKLFGQYTYVRTSSAYDSLVTPAVIDTGLNSKAKVWQLGVSVPVTEKAAVLASYGENKAKSSAPGDESVKDRVFSLGLDYNLSKRTDVYAVFMTNSESAATRNNAAGQTYAVGLRHNF
ncbi:MAG: porin [Aquabacterium sp.]